MGARQLLQQLSPCPDFGTPKHSLAVLRGLSKPGLATLEDRKRTLLTEVCDHTETFQVEYDPKVTNYSNLLRVFWDNHDVTVRKSSQYKSAIFYHNEEQKKLAEESAKVQHEKIKKKIVTEILPAEVFYDAEDYHQKYMLRNHRDILKMLNLTPEELKDSTAATRLNGYLAHHGSKKKFDAEIKSLNLSPAVVDAVCNLLF